MSLNMQSYKGARDFYPEDMRVRDFMFSNWRSICQRFGYEEYDAPIIEPVELFMAKSGDELVNEQGYNFVDRGGREVMLRPEMTPSTARLVAGRRQELPLPIRWFSIPSCWRYERPQKGRGREFYQLNVDLFGVDNLGAEVEMLQMIAAIMGEFGAKADMYTIKVNSRVLMDFILKDWLGLDEVEQKTITRIIDRKHKLPSHEFVGQLEASMSPSLRDQGAVDRLLSVLDAKDINSLPVELQSHDSYKMVQEVMQTAQSLGISNIRFDTALVRGLDYYTDFVFEVFDTNPDNNRSVFGGGRYDGLVGLFGVDPLPTIGFGMSDVMLLEFLNSHNLVPDTKTATEVVVLPIGEVQQGAGKIAAELREMGVNTALDNTERKIDKQLKAAVKTGVPYVLIVGEQELKDEQYKLKNLKTGEETTHSIQRIVSIIKDSRRKK